MGEGQAEKSLERGRKYIRFRQMGRMRGGHFKERNVAPFEFSKQTWWEDSGRWESLRVEPTIFPAHYSQHGMLLVDGCTE